MKKMTFFGVAAATTLCAMVTIVAQDAQEANAPSPEMMARMQPGPMHEKLESLVGSWQMDGKWRTTPDATWEPFDGIVEREWILDKRFVKETMTCDFMGQPFTGIGFIGYDNMREELTMVWIENMSTGTWLNTGQLEGNTLTFEGENSDVMTGEMNHWTRSVIDLSTLSYVGYAKDTNGAEFISMEMTATPR